MSNQLVDEFRHLQMTPWSTWEEGAVRQRAFPHSVTADYRGHPSEVHFGAFIGWTEPMKWWVELAARLSLPPLHQLLDVEHQAGGYSCIAWFCQAAPVKIRVSCVGFVSDLCRDYYHANGGWMNGSQPEADIEQYQVRLSTVGLTAKCMNEPGSRLLESVYPMDGSDKNLKSLLAEPSEVLSKLLPITADKTARDRLKVYILADNSD